MRSGFFGMSYSSKTVVPQAPASRERVDTDGFECDSHTELRKPAETPARPAASARLRPCLFRSFRNLGPKSGILRPSVLAFAGRLWAMASLIPGTLSLLTSWRYLIRFKTSRSSGVYSRKRPELRAGVTSPTLSQSRRVEGLMPRIRAVCPTVRKRRCCLSSCRAIVFFFMELSSGFWRHRLDPFTRPDSCALMLPILWIFQQVRAFLNAQVQIEIVCNLGNSELREVSDEVS